MIYILSEPSSLLTNGIVSELGSLSMIGVVSVTTPQRRDIHRANKRGDSVNMAY